MTETEHLIASALPSIVKYVPVPPRSPKTHPKKARSIDQLLQMQDELYEATIKKGVSEAAKAQCARAWDVLEDRKRIRKGIGLPKHVETAPKSRQKQPRSSFTESAGPIVVPSVPASPKPE